MMKSQFFLLAIQRVGSIEPRNEGPTVEFSILTDDETVDGTIEQSTVPVQIIATESTVEKDENIFDADEVANNWSQCSAHGGRHNSAGRRESNGRMTGRRRTRSRCAVGVSYRSTK